MLHKLYRKRASSEGELSSALAQFFIGTSSAFTCPIPDLELPLPDKRKIDKSPQRKILSQDEESLLFKCDECIVEDINEADICQNPRKTTM